jgi:hypothetical protein
MSRETRLNPAKTQAIRGAKSPFEKGGFRGILES